MNNDTAGFCECGCGTKTTVIYGTGGKRRRFFGNHWNEMRKKPPYLTPDEYRTEDRGHETACWIPVSPSRDCKGYFRLMRGGLHGVKAHKAQWESVNGPVPAGLELDHLCRVRECVRPDHLEAVTHRVNCLRGSNTKLDDKVIRGIRNDTRAQRQIARDYGVSQSTVWRIKRYKTRSEVVQ